MGEAWNPLDFTLSASDSGLASSLLLSHAAGPVRHASLNDAAYALSLFGECEPPAQIQLLTALAVLMKTRPIFPVVAALGERCAASKSLVAALRSEGALPVAVPEVKGVKCNGRRYGPDSKVLAANATSSYFDATYTILAAWNLTQYRAVLILDSDLAVRRSLDHVLLAMLERPEIAEARTPEGCLDAVSVGPKRGNYFNTGVWGVRPDAMVYADLVRWLTAGSKDHQCGIGIQTAAKGFFSDRRIDVTRFDAPRHCCAEWREHAAHAAHPLGSRRLGFFSAGADDGGKAKQATEHKATEHKLRPWEILQLHAGYNGKANAGIVACLHKDRHGRGPRLTVNDSFVVHWSGSRKPLGLTRGETKDHLEAAAWAEYVNTYCQLWMRHGYAMRVREREKLCQPWLARAARHRMALGAHAYHDHAPARRLTTRAPDADARARQQQHRKHAHRQ